MSNESWQEQGQEKVGTIDGHMYGPDRDPGTEILTKNIDRDRDRADGWLIAINFK